MIYNILEIEAHYINYVPLTVEEFNKLDSNTYLLRNIDNKDITDCKFVVYAKKTTNYAKGLYCIISQEHFFKMISDLDYDEKTYIRQLLIYNKLLRVKIIDNKIIDLTFKADIQLIKSNITIIDSHILFYEKQ